MLWEFRTGFPLLQIAALVFLMVGRFAAHQMAVAALPPPVVAAVEADFPGASWRRVETEHEGGRRVHEVTVRHRRATFEVRVTPAGEVVEVERLVTRAELPPAVLRSLACDHSKAIVDKVEEVSRGGRVVGYEVAFAGHSGRASKVTFDPTGRVASE